MRTKKWLGEAGDTIVEVMVALAVASLLIGGAMASARQSLQGSQRAGERSEAQKIAESQIEQLRAIGFTTIGSATNFYFNASGSLTAGVGTSGTTGVVYSLAITRPTSSDHIFTVTISWPATGGGTDNVIIRYGVY